MNQDFSKVFKTPKYTGVTLSLLSMFVLASMLVVWDKLSISPSGKNSNALEIICEIEMKQVMSSIIKSFYKECEIGSNVAFLTEKEISTFLLTESNASTKILLVKATSDEAIKNSISRNFLEKLTVGSIDSDPRISSSKDPDPCPILCLVGKNVPMPSHALALARFLSAPDRGQSFLEKDGYNPLSGDPWQRTPAISIYANPKIQNDFTPAIRDFSTREGVQIEINFKMLKSVNETISIIAKSNASQYFPDFLVGYDHFLNKENLYLRLKHKDSKISCYVSKESKSLHSAKRLATSIQNYF